jgi:hypothetical protein
MPLTEATGIWLDPADTLPLTKAMIVVVVVVTGVGGCVEVGG